VADCSCPSYSSSYYYYYYYYHRLQDRAQSTTTTTATTTPTTTTTTTITIPEGQELQYYLELGEEGVGSREEEGGEGRREE